MKFVLKVLLTALAVVATAHFLPGVTVDNYSSAIFVALVLAILRVTIKPVLIFLTLPATIVTLGLFLLVINAIIILMASYFVDGFYVSSFGTAMLFSLLLWVFQTFLHGLLKDDKTKY